MISFCHYIFSAEFAKKTAPVEVYCTPSDLLVVEMDVSSTKTCLDTSILATSNMDQREYLIYSLSYLILFLGD